MHCKLTWSTAILMLFNLALLYSQESNLIPFEEAYKRKYFTERLKGKAPLIDGSLQDSCWIKEGSWSQNFIQNTPVERGIPSYPTRIKILYDDRNIYFALRACDPHPDKINRFVGNRDDNSIGDLISVCFDTYHDYRAGTEFNINAGGNKTDLIVSDNLTVNLNWNAVWDGKTGVNDSSWTAEFRIPFSQLRYNQSDTGMVWGLHVRRIMRNIQETDQWSLIPRKNSGHVYSFGELYGLRDIRKPRLFECLPYVSGKLTQAPSIQGSPYNSLNRFNGNAGIDAKLGIGNFTFDITVNPDFGQIEADPSVMNLTAFETFYEEKRPFFLEGKHIFDYSADQNMMFYSRRIGHAPSYAPGIDNQTSFSRMPEFTNILNAIKLTGTTRNGLSVGILQSTTQKEIADYTVGGVESHPAVEPLTNYFVARVMKTAKKGDLQLGGMVTSTNRLLDESQLNFLNQNAFTLGMDYLQYFRSREYYVDARAMVSDIYGRQEAMLALQQNALHYFQRPDANRYLKTDSSLRSLTGTGGYLSFGRKGNKKLIYAEKFNWWSPGFDLNDLGYQYMADLIENHLKVSYRKTDPGKIFRNYTLSLAQNSYWNYGGTNTQNDIASEFAAMFSNRWEITLTGNYILSDYATRLLRGGPAMRLLPYWTNSLVFNTNKSRRIAFRFQGNSLVSTDGLSRTMIIKPGILLRIGNHLYCSVDLNYTHNQDNLLYVTQVSTSQGKQYLLGHINQHTYSTTLRINYNITPDLSVQYYGSPFISSGSYGHFKRAGQSRSDRYRDRFHEYTTGEISYDPNNRTYQVNEDGNTYSFSNPDFSFREYRSNLVIRWEYRRGSSIYLVWENNRSNREYLYESSLEENMSRLSGIKPTNIFMIKISYWLGL